MRRIRPKINRAKRLFKHRKVPEKNLQQRARKAGIRFVRKRVAGKKGTQYTKLSAAAKMHIDKKVSKQQKIVTNIARRLNISIKRKMKRVAALLLLQNKTFKHYI